MKRQRVKRAEDGDSADDSVVSTSSNLEAFANDDLGTRASTHTQAWHGYKMKLTINCLTNN